MAEQSQQTNPTQKTQKEEKFYEALKGKGQAQKTSGSPAKPWHTQGAAAQQKPSSAERPKLKLNPLSPEKQALSDAGKAQSKQSQEALNAVQADLFLVFDQARKGTADQNMEINQAANKHCTQLGLEPSDLYNLIKTAIKGVDSGNVFFTGDANSLTFSISLVYAFKTWGDQITEEQQFGGKTLNTKLKRDQLNTSASIKGEVKGGKVTLFHTF